MSTITTHADGEIVRELRGQAGIQATIWRNQTSAGPSHTVTLSRSWRTQDGSWETRKLSLPLATLLSAAEVLEESYREVWNRIATEREQGGEA